MQGIIFLYDFSPYDNIIGIDYEGNIIGEIGYDSDLIKGLRYARSLSVAPDGSVYSLELWRVVRYKLKPGLPATIPTSASTKGANNTQWKTDLSIFNPSEEIISVDLNYLSNFEDKTINLNLNPEELINFNDIIANLFQMPQSFGAITFICLNETQPLIFSRTYTEKYSGAYDNTSSGRYGQGIRASPYENTFYRGEKAHLIGLKNNNEFRTNIGFFNLKEFPVEINLKLYNEEGEEIGSTKYNLEPFQQMEGLQPIPQL